MLSKDLKVQLVHAFILSRIDYGNICLYGIKKSEVYQLQKLLNSAVRFIFNLTGDKYREHISPYLKDVHFLKVEYRIRYKVALSTFKCMNNMAPKYLDELVTTKKSLDSLRISNDHFLLEFPPLPKTSSGYRRFTYAAPNEWNTLPYGIRSIKSIETFKKHLKTYYFNLCFVC